MSASEQFEDDYQVRGMMGISSTKVEQYWPVNGCKKDSHCWPAQIRAFAGWRQSSARNLACDGKKGTCKCRLGFMDADDNPMNGCEKSISEKKVWKES